MTLGDLQLLIALYTVQFAPCTSSDNTPIFNTALEFGASCLIADPVIVSICILFGTGTPSPVQVSNDASLLCILVAVNVKLQKVSHKGVYAVGQIFCGNHCIAMISLFDQNSSPTMCFY